MSKRDPKTGRFVRAERSNPISNLSAVLAMLGLIQLAAIGWLLLDRADLTEQVMLASVEKQDVQESYKCLDSAYDDLKRAYAKAVEAAADRPATVVNIRDGRTVACVQTENILRCIHGKPLTHPCAECANERYREAKR